MKTAMPFLKWHIDMTIQLQVLIVYVHKYFTCATTQLAKIRICKLSLSNAPKAQQIER